MYENEMIDLVIFIQVREREKKIYRKNYVSTLRREARLEFCDIC
jgi:hypothetical protein